GDSPWLERMAGYRAPLVPRLARRRRDSGRGPGAGRGRPDRAVMGEVDTGGREVAEALGRCVVRLRFGRLTPAFDGVLVAVPFPDRVAGLTGEHDRIGAGRDHDRLMVSPCVRGG